MYCNIFKSNPDHFTSDNSLFSRSKIFLTIGIKCHNLVLIIGTDFIVYFINWNFITKF